LTRRGSIITTKKDMQIENTASQLGIKMPAIQDPELGRKKMKQTAKDRKATMKNSYINGIKK